MNINNRKITIKSENELQNFFNDKSLKMKKNSKLVFYSDLKIDQNILIEGNVKLGKKNKIQKDCLIKNVKMGNNNLIKMSSLIENTNIANDNIVGPFAFLRDGTKIHNNCIIGAYVEITRSLIYNYIFISHRAFVGDAKIYSNTIIGAGAVFCNYNFKKKTKEKSIVGKNCKIGSNSTIIAPCKIEANTLVPALTKFKK